MSFSLIRRIAEREGGYTLVELGMSMVISSMIFAAMVSVLYSFTQQAGDTTRSANLQQVSRELVADMVVELRQAEKVAANGHPIELLNSGMLVFYSDRLPPAGPERIVYERKDCADGICELWVSRYPAIAGGGPWWSFSETPIQSGMVLHRIPDDEPLFEGADWVGSPATKVQINSCGPSGPECDFPLIQITFRSKPINTSPGADFTLEVQEEVRLRND
ncbi:MAG: type II secretion system protein [Deltaproteobacteria bacterium]|nr:type II secretion system protein [Deltaproteobacteria bacterium]